MSKNSVFDIFELLEKTSSRNEMIDILVAFYSSLNLSEAQIYTYLFAGRVVPLFVDREFHFSEKLALKVLENINKMYDLGLNISKLRNDLGDAGLVAKEVVETKGIIHSKFKVEDVYEKFWELIHIKGVNSVKLKSSVFSDLILSSSPVDAKFLTRILSGKLRLGCSDKTILDSFSFFLVGDKSIRAELDNAYGVISDLGFVCNMVFDDISLDLKLKKLKKVTPIIGIPISPRLVERVASFEDAAKRFSEGGVLQPKFDGLRCQIHKGVKYSDVYKDSVWIKYVASEEIESGLFENKVLSNEVKLFSRNLNDITEMFPELVKEVNSLEADNFIIDGEIVGWDEDKSKYTPFQETMSRRRKYGISESVKSVPVNFFAFDLLFLKGENLLNVDLKERLNSLSSIENKRSKFLKIVENTYFKNNIFELQSLFDKYVKEGLEGVILKKLEGGYLPGVRNFDWVKIKKSIGSKVVDTIDAVVLGYYYGSGKKTEFGVGSLLIGVYNSEKDVFESVGKLGTGFTDEVWRKVAKQLTPLKLSEKPHNVVSKLGADVWVEPEIVLTVEADEISKSSVHLAGKSELGYGLSLRFPRLIEFGRDKLAKDTTSSGELVSMWNMNLGQKKDPQI